MEKHPINISDGTSRVVVGEDELGIFGPRVTEADLRRIQQDLDRKELYAKMAANMIIEDRPRNNYFVREPGL